MDTTLIFTILERGLRLLPVLIETGINVTSTITKLTALSKAAKAGTVTKEMIVAVRTDLDAKLAEFNADI